jgi:hypothetical protein
VEFKNQEFSIARRVTMSTNYYDTFIEVADDCPAGVAEIPAPKGGSQTAPGLQYELIANHPYKYTQDDVLFEVFSGL